MSEAKATARPWYVGAQNDALFVIAGRPPSKSNDYPVHDADRVVIAKVYDDANAALIVEAVNTHDSLLARNKKLTEALTEMREAFEQYIDWNGAVHVDGCPCDCRGKSCNDAVSAAFKKSYAALAEDKEQTHESDYR